MQIIFWTKTSRTPDVSFVEFVSFPVSHTMLLMSGKCRSSTFSGVWSLSRHTKLNKIYMFILKWRVVVLACIHGVLSGRRQRCCIATVRWQRTAHPAWHQTATWKQTKKHTLYMLWPSTCSVRQSSTVRFGAVRYPLDLACISTAEQSLT